MGNTFVGRTASPVKPAVPWAGVLSGDMMDNFYQRMVAAKVIKPRKKKVCPKLPDPRLGTVQFAAPRSQAISGDGKRPGAIPEQKEAPMEMPESPAAASAPDPQSYDDVARQFNIQPGARQGEESVTCYSTIFNGGSVYSEGDRG